MASYHLFPIVMLTVFYVRHMSGTYTACSKTRQCIIVKLEHQLLLEILRPFTTIRFNILEISFKDIKQSKMKVVDIGDAII